MNILFLEKSTVDPDGLDFSEIEAKGQVRYFPSLDKDEQIEACRDADVLIVNKTKVTREYFENCPRLKCVCLLATGYNNIDLKAAREFGVAICNVPGYSTDAVAQLTFAFILNFATNMIPYSDSVRDGVWCRCKEYTYLPWPIMELQGKTLGIFGYGTIGKKVASIAKSFGMHILAVSRSKKQDEGVTFCSLQEMLPKVDFLTLHCPLTPETTGIINAETLKMMKPTAYLINTSRGAVVEEQALADALNRGELAGAGIDVLATEPMPGNCPYRNAKNILVTPHIAWAAREARTRLLHEVAENIRVFSEGGQRNRVDLL